MSMTPQRREQWRRTKNGTRNTPTDEVERTSYPAADAIAAKSAEGTI